MRNLLLSLAVMGALGGAWSWVGAICILVVLVLQSVLAYHRARIHEASAPIVERASNRAAWILAAYNRGFSGDPLCELCRSVAVRRHVTLLHDEAALLCDDCAPLLTGVGRG